jgi:hypothetical protein
MTVPITESAKNDSLENPGQGKTAPVLRAKLKDAMVWLLYFCIMLFCALPAGLNTPIDVVGLTNTIAKELPQVGTVDDVIRIYDMGDASTYARMGKNLAQGKFTEYEFWRLRLFAPGDTAIEALSLVFLGPKFPIVLFFTVMTCAFWASVCFNVRALGNPSAQPIVASLLPLLLCVSGLFTIYYLRKGIMLSESLSTAQLSLSFLYLVRSYLEKKRGFAVISGVCLALAAYMRAQNELVGLCLNILGGVFGVIALLWMLVSKKDAGNKATISSFSKTFPALGALLIALVAFNVLTIPYRCWNVYQYKSASWLQWDHYWEANWRDEELMRTRDHDQRLIDQGETVAARVNPTLAAKIREQVNAKGPFAFPDDYYKSKSIMTFLHHPRHWMILKYPAILNAWVELNDPAYDTDRSKELHLEHWAFVLVLLVCIARFLIAAFFWRRLKGIELYYFGFFLALFGANMATTIFIHLEPRYYYTLKIMSLVMVLGWLNLSMGKLLASEKITEQTVTV